MSGVAPAALRLRGGLALAAPVLCAIHCLAAPTLVVIAPALVRSPLVEAVLVGISVALALRAAGDAARRHAERRLWIPAGLGVLAWLAHAAGWTTGASEPIVSVLGSVSLLTAIAWGAVLRHRAACSVCASAAPGSTVAETTD